MNNQRRKDLGAVMDQLPALATKLSEAGLLDTLNSMIEELERLRDEEQEYHDNMPAGVQSGDKGQTAERAISSLEEAIDALTTMRDAIDEFSEEDIAGKIEDARGEA